MEQDREKELENIYYCSVDNDEFVFFVRADNCKLAIDTIEEYFKKSYFKPTKIVCRQAEEKHYDKFKTIGVIPYD